MKNLFLLIFGKNDDEQIVLSSKDTLLSAIKSCASDTTGLDLLSVFHTQTQIEIKIPNTLDRVFFCVLSKTPFGSAPYFPDDFNGLHLQFDSYKECLEFLGICKTSDKNNLEFEIVPFAQYSNGKVINLKSGYEPSFSLIEFDYERSLKKQTMLDEYCSGLYDDIGRILDSHGLSIDNLIHTAHMFKRKV